MVPSADVCQYVRQSARWSRASPRRFTPKTTRRRHAPQAGRRIWLMLKALLLRATAERPSLAPSAVLSADAADARKEEKVVDELSARRRSTTRSHQSPALPLHAQSGSAGSAASLEARGDAVTPGEAALRPSLLPSVNGVSQHKTGCTLQCMRPSSEKVDTKRKVSRMR